MNSLDCIFGFLFTPCCNPLAQQNSNGWSLAGVISSPENLNMNAETLLHLVSVIGALAILYKTWYELNKWSDDRKTANDNRAEDLNWRKVKESRDLYSNLFSKNSLSWQALLMIDFIIRADNKDKKLIIEDIRPFKYGKQHIVNLESIIHALSININDQYECDPKMVDGEKFEYILRCFDNLLYNLGIFQHYIERGLVNFDDLKHPIDYYMDIIWGKDKNKKFDSIFNYAERFKFKPATDFMNRFSS